METPAYAGAAVLLARLKTLPQAIAVRRRAKSAAASSRPSIPLAMACKAAPAAACQASALH